MLHIATTRMSTWEATGPSDEKAMMKDSGRSSHLLVDGYEIKVSVHSSTSLPGGTDFYIDRA